MTAREDTSFESEGVRCAAWHYRPDGDTASGCVVMAHGFGATHPGGLAPSAERFAAAGLNVLAFDYRHIGASDGEPRQLVSIDRQLDDVQAAIEAARRLPGVDPKRIALWGTSFGGGHVIVAAARDPRIVAVSSQCAMYDGGETFRIGRQSSSAWLLVRGVAAAVRDGMRRRLGRAPVTIPIVGEPGSLATMSTPDSLPGFMAIADDDFVNEVAARILLQVPKYRPIESAPELRCPLLIQVAEHDSVVSVDSAATLAELVQGEVQVIRYPIGHFDFYVGEGLERAVTDQVEFFTRHLKAG